MGRLLVFSAVALAAVVLVGTALANHAWGSYHWSRTSTQVTLNVGDNVDTKWDAYLDGAISDWNPSIVLELTKVAGATSPSTCGPSAGRIEACNAPYGTTGWLGIAQIWVSGGHITQAVTKLNDTYFDTATYNSAPWRRLVRAEQRAPESARFRPARRDLYAPRRLDGRRDELQGQEVPERPREGTSVLAGQPCER